MFTGLFTGLRTANRALKAATEANELLAEVQRHLRTLQAAHELLESQHRSLRGKVYATRDGPAATAGSGPGLQGTRDQRRAAALAQFNNGSGIVRQHSPGITDQE